MAADESRVADYEYSFHMPESAVCPTRLLIDMLDYLAK
jgi:hypothetical protein